MNRNFRYPLVAIRTLVALGCAMLLPTSAISSDPERCATCDVATFEDLYGDTGNRFRGAIGFRTRQSFGPDPATTGYGLGIDDAVITWREFRLEEDVHECASTGSCATIELDSSNIFDPSARVTVTVNELTPTDNDCDLDGLPDGTRDCDGDGIEDVVVVARSPSEPEGERMLLNRVRHGMYRGSLPISARYDAPGVLFVAVQGIQSPTITFRYLDLDDGTGRPCSSSADPAFHGRVEVSTNVFLTPASLVVNRVRIEEDNGDHDGWADDGETVTMRVEVSNKSGGHVTGLTLRLFSDDSRIDCITRPFLFFGDLTRGETRFSDEGFEFVVGDVGRSEVAADMTALFQVTMDANEFQGVEVPQTVTLDLDLDASGGSGPTTFLEGFESGLGAFVPMPIDDALNPPENDLGNNEAGQLNADGYRCQYTDPDRPGYSCDFGPCYVTCYPNPNNAPDAFWWSVTTDRAFNGDQALYWGSSLDAALGFTTPTAQLEAVRTEQPINLGWDRVCERDRAVPCISSDDCPPGPPQACVGVTPALSFKHQISLLDWRTVNTQPKKAADRAIVAVQSADESGEPVGTWIKIEPYVNVYDAIPNSNYFNCSFDPIDDGNTEDDLFDPDDWWHRRGPSSTCDPERVFSYQGDTTAFGSGRIGQASDGPGLRGETGDGTWVEPIFDLSRFRGRRIRLRFLTSGLKLGSALTWESAFNFNPDPRDDGWFIDDVTVTDTLTEPAIVCPDLNDNSDLPGCDFGCGWAEASVRASPTSLPAPGHSVTLDGSGSRVDRCIDGVLQYRYWIDVDGDDLARPNADVLLRDWTDDPFLVDAPVGRVRYLLEARCATEPDCRDAASLDLDVDCPIGPGGLKDAPDESVFLGTILPNRRSVSFDSDKATIRWAQSATIDAVRGDLRLLRATAAFEASLDRCVANDAFFTREFTDTDTPPAGEGFYYLLRGARYCNSRPGGSWSTNSTSERSGRDSGIPLSPLTCPD